MGPLAGVRVVEMAALGPVPFAGMLLADLGAEVTRVDRPGEPRGLLPGPPPPVRTDVVSRGRRSVALDLRSPEAVDLLLRLVERADVLLEGFRPGVMERLGAGPLPCLDRNPRLVYGRMTGWGQEGPLAARAGHDIDYVALSGALGAIGRAGAPPTPPLNLVGDYGGGALLLVSGVLAALLHASRTGAGQVVDAAMVDGAALLMAPFFGLRAAGLWADERGSNLLDSGAPFYDVYATADGGYLAVGPLEPRFFAALLDALGIDGVDPSAQYDRSRWPQVRAALAQAFRVDTRDNWVARLERLDVCVAPVLSMAQAPKHAHNVARGTFVDRDGVVQPAPAPRFSATPATLPPPPPAIGEHTDEVLAALGLTSARIAELRRAGIVR